MNKQHVQVPVMEINQSLLFGDPYIYACIKKYMNKNTKQAFPSIQTLTEDTGLNKKTILASIDRLEKEGYIKIVKRSGAPNIYIFNEYTKFEIFSYDFLNIKDLSSKAKSYLVILQHEMKKDPASLSGTIQYNRIQLAEKLGISQPTLRKIEDELAEYGALTISPTNTLELMKDATSDKLIPLSGLKNCVRTYNFTSILNTIALKFYETDQRLDKTEDAISKLTAENLQLKETIGKLVEKVNKLDINNDIIL